MTITTNKLFSGIFLLGLTTILLVLLDIQLFYLRVIFSFIFLTTIPGFLIMLMLKIRKIEFWGYFVYSVGLSVAFLMFGGLAVNWILPWLHITDKPLALIPLLVSFGTILSIFGIISYKGNKDLSLKIGLPKLNLPNKVFFALPLIFPILSILGATTLNNGGLNYITMIMLGGIAVYTFLLVIFREKINQNIFPFALYCISASLLFSFSLRSGHIIGYDIHEEYRLFQLTKENAHWSMIFSPNNPYNACLSITILPTIMSILANIKDEYIFKLLNQILFAFTPLVLFLISKNIKIDNFKSYLIGFFFLSQVWFMLQMPELNRQEYAIFFFSLLICVLFNNRFISKQKTILFILFSFSLVVSHYSTSYILLAILTIYYIVYRIFKIRYNNLKPLISIYMLILIMFSVYIWNFQLTQTGGTLLYTANNAWKNMALAFNSDMLQSGTNRLFFNNLEINTQDNLNMVFSLKSSEYNQTEKQNTLYDSSKYKNYSPVLAASKIIYPQVAYSISNFVNIVLKINKIFIVDILVFIGLLYFVINRKTNNKIELDYLMLSVSTLPLIFAILFFPLLKIDYNIERVYLQTLILTSSLTISGAYFLFSKIKGKYLIISLVIIVFFLQSSGILTQYFGGVPYLNLNNYGYGYDKYYTFDSEIYSARWLSKNNNNTTIYADQLASLKPSAYANLIDIRYDLFPSTIAKSSYIYLSSSNINNAISYINYNIDFITYNTPIKFLSKNKNLIYNSGGSQIYK